jgi:hypothetical protein
LKTGEQQIARGKTADQENRLHISRTFKFEHQTQKGTYRDGHKCSSLLLLDSRPHHRDAGFKENSHFGSVESMSEYFVQGTGYEPNPRNFSCPDFISTEGSESLADPNLTNAVSLGFLNVNLVDLSKQSTT